MSDPMGMTKVTKQAFWSWVMGTKRNVQPTIRGAWAPHGYTSRWVDLHSGELVGLSNAEDGGHYLLAAIAKASPSPKSQTEKVC